MRLPRYTLGPLALLGGLLAVASVSRAHLPETARGGAPSGAFGTATIDNQRRIDANSVSMWVTNFGSFAWDLTTGNSGYVFPKGTNRTAIFASGLWIGCTVAGQSRTLVAEYSQEYGPGAMIGAAPDDPQKSEYRVVKVVRWTGNPADSAHVDRSAEALAQEAFPDLVDPLVHHSWSEYIQYAKPHGAPTRLYDLPDGSGGTVQVEGPDVLGDQMLWAVYNDANPANHTNDAGGSPPLGVEIQQTTFAFDRTGALGNTIFLKYKILNKGGQQLDSMYVSLWCDPDLGGFTDDLVGVDTTLSLGYCYNATNADQLYGSAPPAVGYDFFRGPINALGDTLGMTSFNKYINGTDPASTSETYNYMAGVLPDGSGPVIDPTTGQPTAYFHPGDPITGQGWTDSNPADRRFLVSAGPFYMAPGDTQEVVAGIVIGQGNDRLSSISALRFFDREAQAAFDADFILANPPVRPQVDVAIDDTEITLSWDGTSRTNYDEPGYAFEGYNVWQGQSVAGPWTLLATYDEINNVRVIRDEIFDINTGQTISDYPVQFGSDVGVKFSHTITEDAVRGGPIRAGTEYYFAVTAYSYGELEVPKTLENPQSPPIRVIPRRPAAGTDLSSASAFPVEYSRVDPIKPPTTDQVTVEIVNPYLVTGDRYRVSFTDLVPPFFGLVGSDTATVTSTWNLINVTTGDTLLKDQLNRRGDDDYQIVDGLRVREVGSYFPRFQDGVYQDNNPAHRRALTGVDWGGSGFFGGAGSGWDFFGGTIDPGANPDSFTTVEIRFDQANTQKAYRFLRLELADESAPAAYPDRGYLYGTNVDGAGFVDVPFTCWDAINDVQLDVAIVERAVTDDAGVLAGPQPPTYDMTWGPDASGLGGREYLLVIRRPYSDTEKPEIAQDATIVNDVLPLMYGLWSRLRAASDVIDDGDVFEFIWANPATPNDIFEFDTSKLSAASASAAGGALDRVRVVPNPYYTRSRYEVSPFNRIMRFMNLPSVCTIRIFNLAGDLVRTLEHPTAGGGDPDAASIENWDLKTDGGLPVGSGVYVFHIDAPGVGTHYGRLAVFMESERLNNF